MAGDAQATPEPSESATLADVIHAARTEWIKQPPWLGVDDGYADYLARAVLASTWLADHDKRVRDEALAEVAEPARGEPPLRSDHDPDVTTDGRVHHPDYCDHAHGAPDA